MNWTGWQSKPPFNAQDGRVVYPMYTRGANGEQFEGGTIYVFDAVIEPDDIDYGTARARHEVAQFTWNRSVIQYVGVNEQWLRQGIATKLLQLARTMEPQLRHNDRQLTDDARRWIAAVDPDYPLPPPPF